MVSDTELVNRLREVLRTSDLNTTTAAAVRRTLEAEFGVDLSDRKAFIRDQIDLFLESRVQNTENDVVVDDNAEEEIDDEKSENVKPDDDDNNSGSEEVEEAEEESDEKRSKKGRSDIVDNAVKKKGGFSKPCGLSPQLQKFVGVSELARPEVVKKIWAYIREKDLQDPKNRRKILCDEALHALFRVNSINMFQMNKVLSKHIWSLNEEYVPVKSSQKEKQNKQRREDSNEPKQKVKQQKRKGSGFLAPLPLSDALVEFFGTGEKALSRADVVKRIWEYIKQNDLQDPSDKRRVICDEKLKELFEVDSFTGFTVSKLLTAHFIKADK